MAELGDDSEAEHRAVGEYAASRAGIVVAVGEAARAIYHGAEARRIADGVDARRIADGAEARTSADGAGKRAVALADNAAAIDWLRDNLAAGDVVLIKASRAAHLDEVAAALM